MEHTERFIASLEDALIAARQETLEVEARLAKTMQAAFGPARGRGSASHYYTRALYLSEKVERLKAEREVLIGRLAIHDCPYESCTGQPGECRKCWTEWLALEGGKRMLANSAALKKALRVDAVYAETARREAGNGEGHERHR